MEPTILSSSWHHEVKLEPKEPHLPLHPFLSHLVIDSADLEAVMSSDRWIHPARYEEQKSWMTWVTRGMRSTGLYLFAWHFPPLEKYCGRLIDIGFSCWLFFFLFVCFHFLIQLQGSARRRCGEKVDDYLPLRERPDRVRSQFTTKLGWLAAVLDQPVYCKKIKILSQLNLE